MLASRHIRISRRTSGSAILCASIRGDHAWSTEAKKLAYIGVEHLGHVLARVCPCATPREPDAASAPAESHRKTRASRQGGHAERSLTAIGFGDPDAPNRLAAMSWREQDQQKEVPYDS
jgi:hypothetical protein